MKHVALISQGESPTMQGLKHFLETQNIKCSLWSSPPQVEAGPGVVVFYQGENPNPQLDQVLQEAIRQDWRLLNRSMPWVQDKAEEYRLYQSLGAGHLLPWQEAAPGVAQSFQSEMYVVKPRVGKHGQGVARFSDWQVALQHAESLGPSVIQPYKTGKVVRALTSPSQVLTSYEKQPQGEWVAAVARGATRDLIDLPPGAAECLTDLTDKTGADLIGFDLIVDGEEFWILEGNAAPALPWEVIQEIDPPALIGALSAPLSGPPGLQHPLAVSRGSRAASP